MNLVLLLGRVELALAGCGFVLLITALVADFAWRLFAGENLPAAPQVALAGFIAMALFSVGVAAHVSHHKQLRLPAGYPSRWRQTVVGIRHFVTSVFFLGLFSLAVYACVESRVLGDVTAIAGWPLWLLQGMMVISFALNSLRFLLYAFDVRLRPVQPAEPWLRQQDFI